MFVSVFRIVCLCVVVCVKELGRRQGGREGVSGGRGGCCFNRLYFVGGGCEGDSS